MFGESWEPATAKIVAKKFKNGSVESGSRYEYIADVTPDSGAPAFRTTLHEPLLRSPGLFRSPHEGATVKVEANVKKEKAKFDMSDPMYSTKETFKAETDTFNAAKAGAVGTPVNAADRQGGEDPRLQLLRTRVKTATMQGNLEEVARLEEMIRKVEAGELPMPTSTPAAAPVAADPLDRLKKLAELHESGVLTNEEFAEQKAKILAES